VNEFNDVATTPLEEWLDYLKNGRIKDNTTTPGLAEAREKLQYMQMSRADQLAYERHLDAIMVQNDSFDAARLEGRAEGLEMGRLEGRSEGMEMGRAEGMEIGRTEGMEIGRTEGRAEGMKMGRAEGAQGKAMEIAKKMKAAGMSDSDIANMTGLSVQEISDLR
jgi:predicted transposase YdaD